MYRVYLCLDDKHGETNFSPCSSVSFSFDFLASDDGNCDRDCHQWFLRCQSQSGSTIRGIKLQRAVQHTLLAKSSGRIDRSVANCQFPDR